MPSFSSWRDAGCYQQQQAAATTPDVPLAIADNSDSVDKSRLPRIKSGKESLSPFLRHGSTARLVRTVLAVCLHCRTVPVFHVAAVRARHQCVVDEAIGTAEAYLDVGERASRERALRCLSELQLIRCRS